MRKPPPPSSMEAQRSQSAGGEGPGRQDPPPAEPSGPAPEAAPLSRPAHGRHRHLSRHPKRLLQPAPSASSGSGAELTAGWRLMEVPGPSGGAPPSSSPAPPPPPPGLPLPHPGQEPPEGGADPRPAAAASRRERKPPKPGKYVCSYCGRPCAKPSVLQKHIRSHTGERPYPCTPCGFSFKTKSNLYKHRKSHAHRIKAGLASSRQEEPEEPTEGESTDSEEETGQHVPPPPTSSTSTAAPEKQKSGGGGAELPSAAEDSHAVKQRLAMRLSERKRLPAVSTDDAPSPSSSLGPSSSKGSTESGYFSRSGSAELSHTSPPNASAKTYAEIILGKYGRLGPQQRSPRTPTSSGLGAADKSGVPFSVPKTQVIEHITKLITINEAVVDTSEIDSVKPRRSSLSRRSSVESPKFSALKEPYGAFDHKKGEPPGSSGTCGAPLSLGGFSGDSFRSGYPKQDLVAPLLRSQSMPSSAASSSSSSSHRNVRLSQSFDEQQGAAAELRTGPHQRMLRRQPAIEVPLGAEFIPEEAGPSSSSSCTVTTAPPAGHSPPPQAQQQHRRGPRVYECEACGTRCKKRENYETHRRCFCVGRPPQEPPQSEAGGTHRPPQEPPQSEAGGTHRGDRPQMMHYKFRAMAMAVRKRRKEESLEEDPPSPGPAAVTFPPSPGPPAEHDPHPHPHPHHERKSTWTEISVIQHTSSFEKQDSVVAMESQQKEEGPVVTPTSSPLPREDVQPPKPPQTPLQQQPPSQHQPPKPHPFSRLVRQHNIQVPEILVTEEPDADMVLASPPATTSSSTAKEPEKVEEFQWPQRSQSLAQLPAEKLPPKKKRLRLAEAAQSSGESSFESASLPRSPSQESSVSHTSSRSASFEESAKADAEMQPAAPGAHMLTVPPGPHPHREMRRSASEQAPPSAQHPTQIAEARSKSFDYGSLSQQHSATAWRERRKCLLVKHATLAEPEGDEPPPNPDTPQHNPGSSSRLSPEASGASPGPSHLSSSGYPRGGQLFPAAGPRTFLHTAPPAPPLHPAQLRLAERLGLPLQPLPPLLSLGYPSGAAQALYLPLPSGLALHVPPDPAPQESKPSTSQSPPTPLRPLCPALPLPLPLPVIVPCQQQLAPVVSLVVPVRLQTHMPTYARAVYTTLSQVLPASPACATPVCCSASWVIMSRLEGESKARSPYLKVPTPDFKSYLPIGLPLGGGAGPEDAYGAGPGVGGSKRMLSPAGSLELSTEAQRQQKRVKEEEEEEEEGGSGTGGRAEGKGEVAVETIGMAQEAEVKQEEEEEAAERKEAIPEQAELLKGKEKQEEEEREEEGQRTKSPAYPTLNTTTSVSWCYLNYVKPNPSPQRDPQASVYASWCVSVHNPNLPGLSTRAALSLLHSKQKHTSETYTMATASQPTTGRLVPASSQKPRMSEVRSTPPSTSVRVKEAPPPEEEEEEDEEEEKGKREEEAPSTSKRSEPSRIRIFEGGYKSNEEYVYVRGRGRGKYVCEECGIRCKKPSMLKKHIRTHTDVRPYVCKHCNFAFKTKGNLTKHMKSKAHGKKCQEVSSLDQQESEEGGGDEEHQFSDIDDSEDDDDNEEEEEDESSSHDEPPSSCSPDARLSSGLPSQRNTPEPLLSVPQEREPGPSQQDYPSPRLWPSGRTASPGGKRALFSRQHQCSPRAFSPSLSPSLSPGRGLSPGRDIPRALPSPVPPGALPRAHRPPVPPAEGRFSSDSPKDRQEKSSFSLEGVIFPEACPFPPALRLSPSPGQFPGPPPSPTADHIFSHLPLHSQRQSRSPYVMIPIGGIQMVQPWPLPKPAHSPTPTPTTTLWTEAASRSLDRRGGVSLGPSVWGALRDYRVPGEEAGTSQSGLGMGRHRPPPKKQVSQTVGEEPPDTGIKQYGSSSTSAPSVTPVAETTGSSRPAPSQPTPPTHRTRQLSDREGPLGGRTRRRGSEHAGGGAEGRVTTSARKNKDSKTGST
ncbi:hypothetical protein SKAU_G00182350 [Synaphobranchus kaupii]|uniref:Transcription factor HIVEP3 n=1 Tax=Synaphobranchus kaupii TaxID=118154 RepID=A0A9Q1FBS4_SYNKA|nr:hypothetical protein SKAU_G00182350 [Synaphobranchus kaupii]